VNFTFTFTFTSQSLKSESNNKYLGAFTAAKVALAEA